MLPTEASAITIETRSVESRSKRSSMIYNVLPAAVQSRIPALPSIRRSLSDIRGRTLNPKGVDALAEISLPGTPPPSYSERPYTARSNRSSVVSADGESIFPDDVSERPESLTSTPPTFSVFEAKTGINWKYASQGISLLTQAFQESHALTRRADDTSTVLTRQLYIHGMTYLLRGLPSEPTTEETLSLHAAMPSVLIRTRDEPTSAMVPFTQDNTLSPSPPSDPSILHRITALLIFQTFIMIQFLLPYIKLFIGHAYRFERDHKLTQRLVSNGIMTADAVRKKSLQLSHTICQMNDGKVGQAINDVMVWWVRGLTGGLQQGIAEGVTVFSNERPAS